MILSDPGTCILEISQSRGPQQIGRKNKFVRTKMRLKYGTKIELQKDLSDLSDFSDWQVC